MSPDKSIKDNRAWLLPLIAALVAIASYAQCVGFDFVYDDIPLIKDNPSIRSLSGIPSLFMQEDMLDESHTGYYRPLVSVADALVYAAFGPSPAAFHAMGIAYHAAAVVLLYLLLLRLTASAEAAFAASLLFAVHPLNTESVAFISGKSNVLCAVFTLGSILAYMRYRDGQRSGWLWLSLVLFACGLLTKEFAVMAPVVMVVMDLLRVGQRPRARTYAAFGVAVLLYLVERGIVLGGVSGAVRLDLAGLPVRMAGMIDVLAVYMRLVIFPMGQKALYDVSLAPSLMTLASAAPLVALLYAAWRLRRSMPGVTLGIAWFFIFLAPVMNVIPVSGSPMAERYLYIPLMGAAIVIGVLYARVGVTPIPRRAIVAVIVAALFAATLVRSQVWRTDEALYAHMSATAPASYKGHYNLGNLRFKQGRLEEAAELWTKALKAKPDMFAVHNNLGALYNRLGKFELAEQHLRAVLSVRTMPGIYMNLGSALAGQGRVDEAAGAFRSAIAMDSKGVGAYLGLADMLDRAGRAEDALAVLAGAIANVPSDHRPWNLSGAIAGNMGRYGAAYEYFSRALEMEPSCEECEYNMSQLKRAIAGGMRNKDGR